MEINLSKLHRTDGYLVFFPMVAVNIVTTYDKTWLDWTHIPAFIGIIGLVLIFCWPEAKKTLEQQRAYEFQQGVDAGHNFMVRRWTERHQITTAYILACKTHSTTLGVVITYSSRDDGFRSVLREAMTDEERAFVDDIEEDTRP